MGRKKISKGEWVAIAVVIVFAAVLGTIGFVAKPPAQIDDVLVPEPLTE